MFPTQPNSNVAPHTPRKPTITQKERLQKLYNKYRPAGVKAQKRSPKDKNAKSYAEMAKDNKGKGKEQVQKDSSNKTVDDSKHNPNKNNSPNKGNKSLEDKLDLTINKLDDMQKLINSLNERINKGEE